MPLREDEMQEVMDLARKVAQEEIALDKKPKVKVVIEPEPVKTDVKHK